MYLPKTNYIKISLIKLINLINHTYKYLYQTYEYQLTKMLSLNIIIIIYLNRELNHILFS